MLFLLSVKIMYVKRRRRENKEMAILLISVIIFIYFFIIPIGATNDNLRQTVNDKKLLSVAILTKKRDNAFYLNDVVSALKYSNVHVFDADENHVDLIENFNQQAFIHKIYSGDYTTYLPFSVSTDAHKTHRYDGVNVVRSTIRKRWWEHQNMDFLKMVRHMRDNYRSKFYLILEDDNVYNSGMDLRDIINYNEPIIHMGLGAGALLMSDEFLEAFIGYMMLRTDAQPVDWLLELFISSIGRKMVHKKLFNHVGSVSTKPDQRNGMF